MHPKTPIAAIILAAGSSSRMGDGRHKLLLPLGSRAVLTHVVSAALASQAQPIIVVLGHQAEQVRASISEYTLHPALTLIENPDYLQGMSSSLHAGIRALMTDHIDGAIILLGDQPLMTPQIIDRLIETKRTTGQPIIAPLYSGKRGNPVLFDAILFPELLGVTGDEGGRRVIERHRQEIATVEVTDAMASYDVDTWEAYQRVVRAWQRQQNLEGE